MMVFMQTLWSIAYKIIVCSVVFFVLILDNTIYLFKKTLKGGQVLGVFNNYKNRNYLICKKKNKEFDNYYDIGSYKFSYNNSDAILGKANNKEVIIYGVIVDSSMPNRTSEEIIDELLALTNFNSVIEKSKKYAGRYVIIYYSKEGLYILPDATATIHVAYTTKENELYVSSNPKIIADINGFKESVISKKIKASAEETHPLPYDMSMYDEIKYVIPNYYLNCRNRTAYRYYPLEKINKITVLDAAQASRKLIGNIIMAYKNNYKLSIPLTSGMDSRTILSFCKEYLDEIPTYTFFHDNFTDETADINIPKKMSRKLGFVYTVLKDIELPEEIEYIYKNMVGSNINRLEARNAWTYYKSDFKEYKRLDGQVSPLAKSNFGRNLPEFLAKPSYLVTKTHNHSKENYKEVKRWCDEIDEYTDLSKISKYDLFFWEHRSGKWASNSYLNSGILIDSLNIFNCRELIETWLSVPRKNRCNGEIHKEIIRLNWPELLEYPFNPDEKYGIVYKYSFLYYLASMAKFMLKIS